MSEQDWLTCTNPPAMLEHIAEEASERQLVLFMVACCRGIWYRLSSPRSRRAVELAERYADDPTLGPDLFGARQEAERAQRRAAAQSGIAQRPPRRGPRKIDPEWVEAPCREQAAEAVTRTAGILLSFTSRDRTERAQRVASLVYRTEPSEADFWAWAECLAYDRIPRSEELADQQQERANQEAERLLPELGGRWRAYRREKGLSDSPVPPPDVPALIRELFGNPFQFRGMNPRWLSWQGGANLALAQDIYEEKSFDKLPLLAQDLRFAGCKDADILAHLNSPGPHVRGCWVLDMLLGKS